MIDLINLAHEINDFCESHGWEFCLIGGLALLRWGEPRLTQDADFIVLTGFAEEEDFIDPLLEAYSPRAEDAREFAIRNRVVLLQSPKGIGIDVSLAALPYEEKVIKRSSSYEFLPGAFVRTCSAEDLIILKSFAARGQDWVDVGNIIVCQRGKLDWNYIFEELTALAELKEEPEIVEQLRSLKEKKKA